MTQSLFYEHQPTSTTSSLISEEDDDDNIKNDGHHDHEIIIDKNLCHIMDSIIFNNDFLLKYHEIQNNCNLKVTKKWNIDDSVISNYTDLINYMKNNPTCKTYELRRVVEYDQSVNVPGFISYLGIPSKLPCRVNELLILYKNKCQLFVECDILDSFLKDKSKTNLDYTIKQYGEHSMIIYGNVKCTFNSNMLMWGLKDKIEDYMKSLADVKLGEWFTLAKQFLKNSDTYASDTNSIKTTTTTTTTGGGGATTTTTLPAVIEKSDSISNKNVTILEPPLLTENTTEYYQQTGTGTGLDEEISDFHSDNTSEASYYSTKSTHQQQQQVSGDITNPTNLIDHSYSLVKLKNELIQLKSTFSQLDLKIKNLENSFKENQIQILIRKYFNKINLLLTQQRGTRYKLKNRVKLLSVLWFVLGLFVGPIVYYYSMKLRRLK